MYILIITIHAIFVLITHLLGYRLLEGIFLLLGVFFLFYFSPLFFLDTEKEEKKDVLPFSLSGILSRFSPQESLFLPISLLYIAVYGFMYALFGSSFEIVPLHAGIVMSVYAIFIAYAFFFYWKQDIYFELFRFHTFFTLLSTILLSIFSLFQTEILSFFLPCIGFFGLIASTFLLFYIKKENPFFLGSYLLTLFLTLFLGCSWFFSDTSLLTLAALGVIVSISIFEFSPKISFLAPYTQFFQYFSLGILLILLPIIAFIAFQTLQALAIILLSLIALFFLSIHARYMNYVVFILSIVDVFFIYSLLFSDLVIHPSLSSLFLFIFFLPILIIGTTYFWQEEHPYDFSILHYGSIGFSVLYSVYGVFFIGGGSDILFVLSLCIFGIALLFFLSYFRFRIDTSPTH